ncbi:MAG TPA: hypothetical protein VK465_02830 [Fibrobacteria bacterium]|nr:hypothetical protein [Fibrobacteria bacterium]
MKRSRIVQSTALGLAIAALMGCGQDCLELKRMGDFEYSQGNYANAIRHYERALAADSACAGVGEKLQEARQRHK